MSLTVLRMPEGWLPRGQDVLGTAELTTLHYDLLSPTCRCKSVPDQLLLYS